MKTIAIVVAILFPSVCLAAPFLISDPNPSAVGGYSEITGAVGIPSPVNTQANGSIRVDLASAPVGTSNLSIRVCKTDAIWGVQCSSAVPFVLNRPGAPSAAGNIGLIP